MNGVAEGALPEAFCAAAVSVEEGVGAGLLERECIALFHRVVSMLPGGQRDDQRDKNSESLTRHS